MFNGFLAMGIYNTYSVIIKKDACTNECGVIECLIFNKLIFHIKTSIDVSTTHMNVGLPGLPRGE